MFCKNCGREIDQKTLKKLMEQKDGSVVCSKCRQPLDNAEMCGGFWGLIAASEEKEAAEAETVNMTVMLDENGKPVQMNPRMQNRSSSAIPDANLRMSANDYSSQNSRQSSGPVMYDSAPYEQKAPETIIRRSGARKDTELWITRAIAILLGIALIISLVTRCGKSDQPQDEMTESTEISDVPDNNSDAAVTPSDVSGNSQGAPDEELPSGSKFEKEDSSAESSTVTTEQSSVESSTDSASSTGMSSEDASVSTTKKLTDQNAAMNKKKGYGSVTRTIIIDDSGYNVESKIISDDGSISVERQSGETKELISNIPAIGYEEVYEKAASEVRAVYKYENGFLKLKQSRNNGDVEYTRDPQESHVVIEKYEKKQIIIDPEGHTKKYQSVKKTYDSRGDGKDLVLEKIEYFVDRQLETPLLSIQYDCQMNCQMNNVENPAEFYNFEKYESAEGKPITMVGPNNKYRYDEIRYTYSVPEGQNTYRLSQMAYYLAGEPATGPNGFSYFKCEYKDESTRKDTFYRTDGQEVTVTAHDPFLSDTVIPAFYSYEFPYLIGRPNPDTVAGPGQSTENQAETPQNDPNAQASYRQQEDPSQEVYNDYKGDDGSEYGNEDY